MLAQRRAFLADEQGLGKTIEALAAIEADGAYPAVVVCPASLKLNWLREIERGLPGRGVRVRWAPAAAPYRWRRSTWSTTTSSPRGWRSCARSEPRALVLDESHYCKNAAAKRTRAVQRLAAAVPRDGLVMALTGTPVMNRPPELIAQLRILGRLKRLWLRRPVRPALPRARRAPAPALASARALLRAPPEVRGAAAATRQDARRGAGGAGPTRPSTASPSATSWRGCRSQPLDLRTLDVRVAAALRAERLVRLNALKLLAARGKLHGGAGVDPRLPLLRRAPRGVRPPPRDPARPESSASPRRCTSWAGDSPNAREAALRDFQAPDGEDNQLIVCSIDVAGQGLTLTRSSNVVFLELDWTPAKHDQAEDRCHRIGQQDGSTPTYLLAADTIDETIATLPQRKRAVIGAVTDGRAENEEGVVDALVRSLRGEPYRHLRAVA